MTMKTLPLPTMPINEEKTAVESRIAEIENEMSEAHPDHAFEYWWIHHANTLLGLYDFSKSAFNRAHMLYCRNPRIIIERPPIGGMYALYALGVVSGIAIALVTFLLTVNPN